MAKIKVDLDMLFWAMESQSGEIDYYMDKQTGEILQVSSELFGDDEDEIRDEVEENPDRYIFIEPLLSNESFKIMEDFIDSVSDAEAADALYKALSRRSPFRNFKDTLCEFPEIRQDWFKFHNEALLERAKDWLSSEQIDAELISGTESS